MGEIGMVSLNRMIVVLIDRDCRDCVYSNVDAQCQMLFVVIDRDCRDCIYSNVEAQLHGDCDCGF